MITLLLLLALMVRMEAIHWTIPQSIYKPTPILVPYVASEIEQHHIGPGDVAHGGAGVAP